MGCFANLSRYIISKHSPKDTADSRHLRYCVPLLEWDGAGVGFTDDGKLRSPFFRHKSIFHEGNQGAEAKKQCQADCKCTGHQKIAAALCFCMMDTEGHVHFPAASICSVPKGCVLTGAAGDGFQRRHSGRKFCGRTCSQQNRHDSQYDTDGNAQPTDTPNWHIAKPDGTQPTHYSAQPPYHNDA